MYGLRLSPSVWNSTIEMDLRAMGFTSTVSDPCACTKGSGIRYIMLTLFVDDLLITGPSKASMAEVRSMLTTKFAMPDRRDVTQTLNRGQTQQGSPHNRVRPRQVPTLGARAFQHERLQSSAYAGRLERNLSRNPTEVHLWMSKQLSSIKQSRGAKCFSLSVRNSILLLAQCNLLGTWRSQGHHTWLALRESCAIFEAPPIYLLYTRETATSIWLDIATRSTDYETLK